MHDSNKSALFGTKQRNHPFKIFWEENHTKDESLMMGVKYAKTQKKKRVNLFVAK
jgi:hypothetical protein